MRYSERLLAAGQVFRIGSTSSSAWLYFRGVNMKRQSVFMALALTAVLLTLTKAAPSETREELAARLQHEYGLVKSMVCSFETVCDATSPQQVALIAELRKTSRYARSFELNQFVHTKLHADQESSRMKWWRQGPRERGETYTLSDDLKTASPRSIYAFDGQLVRQVIFPKGTGQVNASIRTIATSHWEADKLTPFTWLYLFAETPYCDIVADATRFEAEEVRAPGKLLTKYTIQAPKLDQRVLILMFDESAHLTERQWVSAPMPGEAPDLGVRRTFADYVAYPDASGETIWFPSRANEDTYVGRLPSGKLVQNTGFRFRVLDLKFNVDIPDSFFDLEIPKDATVYDGVITMDYLKPGDDLPLYVPPQTSRWQLVIVAAAVFLAVVAVILVTWRKRRALS
jgi:hypothetical protein